MRVSFWLRANLLTMRARAHTRAPQGAGAGEMAVFLRADVLEPLCETVLTFDCNDYHESEGVPLQMARALSGVCTAWRAAVVAIGGVEFVQKQTHLALLTKWKRLNDSLEYFDQYFGFCGVLERKRLGVWIDGRLQNMNAHCRELRASRKYLKALRQSGGS